MNTLTLPLRQLTEELVAKAHRQALGPDDMARLELESFQTEGRVLNALMTYENRNQQETFLTIQLEHIDELSNALFRSERREAGISPYASIVTGISSHLFRAVPGLEILPIPLSDVFRMEQHAVLEERWQVLMDHWRQHGIGEDLIEICGGPLKRLASLNLRYTAANYHYLERFLEALENLDLRQEPGLKLLGSPLVELLIRLDFNSLRFSGHCIRLLRTKLLPEPDLLQQQVLLKELAEEMHDLKPLSEIRYGNDLPLLEHLSRWIKAEIKALEKQINRMEFSYKIHKNLTVAEEAVFEKLQLDVGLTKEESLEELARKLAHNHRSKQQPEMSAGRLKKLFSSKDPEVFASLLIWLRKMQERIAGQLKI